MAEVSPRVAENKAEKKTKRKAEQAKHLADLREKLGDVGKDNGKWIVGTNEYKQLVLLEPFYDEKGNYAGAKEIFFWVQPDGTTFSNLSLTGVIKKVKETYKGNLEGLRKQLYNKNFISETDFNTKNETALNEAIVRAARDYSLTEVQKYTVEGQTKFNAFGGWLSGLGSAGTGGENLPTRNIDLVDRDVIEALVRDIYGRETQMAADEEFVKQETDRYMKQIKEGTLTTTTKKGGQVVRQTTKGFSQAQVEAELPERIKKERPGATDAKKSFDFLAFLDSLGAPVV